MKCKKYLLMVIVVLTLIGAKSMPTIKSRRPPESLDVFIEFLENGNIEELRLRVYSSFMFYEGRRPVRNPRSLRRARGAGSHKTIVEGDILIQYLDLLKEVKNITLMPVDDDYEIDAQIYYVFETKRDGILLEVGMWAYSNSLQSENVNNNGVIYMTTVPYLIINGIVVENNDVFYEITAPFSNTIATFLRSNIERRE